MNLAIIDQDTGDEYWTAEQCAEHCDISRSSWSAYVARDIAPPVSTRLNARTPIWKAEEVKSWQAGRPSQS